MGSADFLMKKEMFLWEYSAEKIKKKKGRRNL